MKLPEQAVREFQIAWLTATGEEISYEQAEIESQSFVTLYIKLIEQLPAHNQKTL